MGKNQIDGVVLCGASAYNQKYYLNENFVGLPDSIKEELRIMCVLFTEDVGGIMQLVFDEDGELEFVTSYDEGDLLYDEIGSVLKIKQYQNTKRELLEAVQTYYRIVFLGEGFDEED
ncbi:MAG: DUF6145 family protein [Agathobacter sp.]|nr:DUF6145 family protein [Agathobacter sp.]MDY3888173.1 DUF6145 family protein [Agathobacter sp.]